MVIAKHVQFVSTERRNKMPPICLTDIKGIANIIKQKYSEHLHNMTFVFCYKRADGKYLIFQELFSVPIQRFLYHPSNDSISFSAGWSAWGSPYSLVADANFDEVEVWRDLQDRSRLYNTNINETGAFNVNEWTLGSRKNKTEKNKKKKTKFDSIFEFRTDRIDRVAFYSWGFEVFSSSLSFIALRSRSFKFPYAIDGDNHGMLPEDEDDGEEEAPVSVEEVNWNGKTFDINARIDMGGYFPDARLGISTPSSPISFNDPISYWDRNECDPANNEFDEYLVRTLIEDKEEIESLYNVGQREVNLLL